MWVLHFTQRTHGPPIRYMFATNKRKFLSNLILALYYEYSDQSRTISILEAFVFSDSSDFRREVDEYYRFISSDSASCRNLCIAMKQFLLHK